MLGVEIHGLGYLNKLSQGANKISVFKKQQELMSNEAKVIFDVGSNRGDITQAYLDHFPNSDIFAFEPVPEMADIYETRFKANNKVHLNKIALSDRAGSVTLYVNSSVDTSSLLPSQKIGASSDESCKTVSTIEVETGIIDDFVADQKLDTIDILKMDVQGSELAVLKGAKKALEQNKISIIYTEVYFKPQYVDQPLFYDIATFLKSYGYELQDLYDPYYNSSQILWADALFVKNNLL